MTSSTVTITDAVPDRLPAGGPADQAGEPDADPKPTSGVIQRTRNQPGAVQRCQPVGARRRARARSCSCVRVRRRSSGLGHSRSRPDTARAASSLSGGICVPKMCGITSADSRARCRRSGFDDRLLDEVVERLPGAPVRLLRRGCRGRARPCRSRRRGLKVWQPPQPFCVEAPRARAGRCSPAPPALRPTSRSRPADHESTWLRISEWPRPQSSVQITGIRADAGRRDHEVVVPGRAPRPASATNCGTQKEWMTSSAVMSSLHVAAQRKRQVAVALAVRVLELPGELPRVDLDDRAGSCRHGRSGRARSR